MQLFIKTLSILSMSLLNTSLSHADEIKNGCETQINCTIKTGNTTVDTRTGTRDDSVSSTRGGSGITTTTTTTTSTQGGFGSVGDATDTGVYDQVQQAQNQAMGAMMAGMALAAMGIPQCGRPGGQAACMMGIAGLIAAGLAGSAAGQAAALKAQLGGGEGGADPTTTTDSTSDTTNDVANANAQVDKLKADYAKKGYKINPDGSTTLANGKTVDPSMSAASLAAAGYSSSDIGKIQAGLSDLQKKNKAGASEVGIASAAGGNGMIQGQVGSGAGDVSKAGDGAVESTDIDRNPAAWAGYYKRFGDSLIGVAQSDIFLLIENRVEKERKVMGQ